MGDTPAERLRLVAAAVTDDRFQAACQRYAHENGSSAAVMQAAIAAYEQAKGQAHG